MTKASVVIPSRGGAHRLPVLLSALAEQSHPDWEAIVVVDGDIDGSAQVVERFSDLPVRSIVLPENKGRVTALNTGFAAATGDVLIRCDDDLAPERDYVRSHVEAHCAGPVGVIGLYRNVLEDNIYNRVYGTSADQLYRRNAYAAGREQRWRYWAGNCSVHRETWERVGPYDARYRAYGWEDVDFGFRLHRAGVPVELEPELETEHRAAAVNTRTRVQRAYRSGQARHLFDSIHGSGTSGLPAPPADSTWNHLVRTTARRLSYESAQTTASTIDASLPYLPRPLGRKAIALVVEAASVAGYQNPSGATLDF